MQSHCPTCQHPRAPQDTICGACGLIFATHAPAATLPPIVCPHCSQSVPAAATCGACGAPLVFTYEPLRPGRTLANGRYTVIRPLSKGGMGAISLATDHEAFDRTVVVKAILDYFDPADLQQVQAARDRFLQEARTLSTLRHPAIPQIYTYFQDGAHNYIVMEYIEGHDLQHGLTHHDDATGQLIPGRPYAMTDVLRWGAALCQTLTYLASRQPNPVVHHDIKPANLLLDSSSNDIRLVDFGAARARLLVQTGSIGLQQSSIHGTQGYAAPEQYRGESEPRSDVYALAATLYHLATDDDPRGHPFDFPRLKQIGALGRMLSVALDSDPARRPDANDLQRQIELLLVPASARPIQAPDGSEIDNAAALMTWCERDWWAAANWLYGQLPDQIELWWGQTRLAHDLRAIVAQCHHSKSAGLDAMLALIDPHSFGAAPPVASTATTMVNYRRMTRRSRDSQTVIIENVGRRHIHGEIELPSWIETEHTHMSLPPGATHALRLTTRGDRLSLLGSVNGRLVVRNGPNKLLEVEVRATISRWWRMIIFMHALRRNSLKIVVVVGMLFLLTTCCGGTQIIGQFIGNGNDVAQYTIAVEAMQRNDWAEAVRNFEMMRGIYRDSIALRNQSAYELGREEIRRGNWEEARAALTLADDYRDAQALLEESYNLEAQAEGWLQRRIEAHTNQIADIVFSPDGSMLASAGAEGAIKLWRVSDGMLLRVIAPNIQDAQTEATIVFSADGQTLLASNQYGTTLWRVDDGEQLRRIGIGNGQFSPDRQIIVTTGLDDTLNLWRLSDGSLLQSLPGVAGQLSHPAFSPDGQFLATSSDGQIILWQLPDGQMRWNAREPGTPANDIAFSADGQMIAVGMADGGSEILRQSDGEAIGKYALHNNDVFSVAFSPDGRILASAGADKTIVLLDVSDGTMLRTLHGHREAVQQLAFSADGRTLASASEDGMIMFWQVGP